MSLSRCFPHLFIALSLAACGGGNVTQDTPAPNSAEIPQQESLPSFRANLQSAEATAVQAPRALQSKASWSDNGAPAPTLGAGAIADRAMWSWVDSDIGTTAKQKAMLDFAASHKINLILIHSESLLSKPALLAGFIDRAGARGIKVELLFGAPEWTLTANHVIALNLLKRANAFIAGQTGTRPVGIHFDVEPHSMPEWQTNQASLSSQLLDLYAKLQAAKGPGLYLNADIAMGYEYVALTRGGVTKTLSQWMVDIADRTTVMAYRDYALGEDSISSHAAHPISYALLQGKRTLVGVETTCNLQPAKITFCEEGNGMLESSIASVNNYFSTNSGYGGMAIHDYANYRKLAQ